VSRPHLIETFNTHRMSAEVVQAVATARELELTEVMQAVRRAADQPQQTAQHLIVYGERGSGKSFLMRLVEIEIERLTREESLSIAPALLPEEHYNIRSAPQLIQAIAAKVRGAIWSFEIDFRPLAEAWEAAVAELDAALDQRFGPGLGLVVAMVENFDTLARHLFGGSAVTQKKTASAKAIEQSAAEQLLRKLMNRKGSRLMLIVSATGTVDQDYERPLFQAFKTVDLRIWTPDDCIAYFNRRRTLEQQAALSLQEEARARAIAEFIGGNPRLAQLLGEALASLDARSIAATLDALSDHLADYYRHRLDDLPPQSAALLDALIRKGEPCTQTELAARVGASSQAQIADAFSYLLSSRLLAAGPDKLGAGRLYRLRDRLFVHFYRRRYGELEKALGLAPIAELLESFFTLREREQQARRHLEADDWTDERLTICETCPPVSTEELWAARRIFFTAATRSPASDVVKTLETSLAETTTDENAKPLANMLVMVLAAVAYNDLWEELAVCLSQHPQILPFLKSWRSFNEVGRVWSERVKVAGRAQTYAMIAGQWPAIVRLIELLPLASQSDGHLRMLIIGLVNCCDDAGFLQDMAELLKEGFGEKAAAEIQRLQAFAEVHAASDKETVLQRMDPDLAHAIRRILGLPEPDDLLTRKGRRKGR